VARSGLTAQRATSTLEQYWLCHMLNPLQFTWLIDEIRHHFEICDETKHVSAAGCITAIVASVVHGMHAVVQLNLAS